MSTVLSFLYPPDDVITITNKAIADNSILKSGIN